MASAGRARGAAEAGDRLRAGLPVRYSFRQEQLLTAGPVGGRHIIQAALSEAGARIKTTVGDSFVLSSVRDIKVYLCRKNCACMLTTPGQFGRRPSFLGFQRYAK